MTETHVQSSAVTRQQLISFEQQLRDTQCVIAAAQAELDMQSVGQAVRRAREDLQALIARFEEFRQRLGVTGEHLADLQAAHSERLGYRLLEEVLRLYGDPGLDALQEVVRVQLAGDEPELEFVQSVEALLKLARGEHATTVEATALLEVASKHVDATVVVAAMLGRLRFGTEQEGIAPTTNDAKLHTTFQKHGMEGKATELSPLISIEEAEEDQEESLPEAAQPEPEAEAAASQSEFLNQTLPVLTHLTEADKLLDDSFRAKVDASLKKFLEVRGQVAQPGRGTGSAQQRAAQMATVGKPPRSGNDAAPFDKGVTEDRDTAPETSFAQVEDGGDIETAGAARVSTGPTRLPVSSTTCDDAPSRDSDSLPMELATQPARPEGLQEGKDEVAATGNFLPDTAQDSSFLREVGEQVWQAILGGRMSLAYHAARYFGLSDPTPAALRLALLGEGVLQADEALLAAYEDAVATANGEILEWDQVNALIAFAGFLPGTLADPRVSSLALAAARQLPFGSELHDLLQALSTLTSNLHGTSFLEQAEAARQYVEWTRNEDRLVAGLEDELRSAPLRSVNYQPAAAVWKSFWHADGFLAQAFRAALQMENGVSDVPVLSPTEIERRIQETNRAFGKKGEIQFTALRQTMSLVQESLHRLEEFAAHRRTKPEVRYQEKAAVDFMRAWEELKPSLTSLADPSDERSLAAMSCLWRIIELLDTVMADPGARTSQSLRELTGRTLLRNGLGMDETGDLAADELTSALLREALLNRRSWLEAFDDYLRQGNLLTAWEVLGQVDGERPQLEQRWQEAAREQRLAALRHLDSVQKAFDLTGYQGLLTETEVEDYQRRLTEAGRQLEASAGARMHYGLLSRTLERLREELGEKIRSRVAGLSERLARLDLAEDVRRRIQEKLDQNDVQTAQEYLDYAERGEDLPDLEPIRSRFFKFFPTQLEEIDHYIERVARSSANVLRDLGDRSPRYVPDVASLPGAQVKTARDMLEAWFEVKSPSRFSAALLTRLLGGMGFSVIAEPIRISNSHPQAWEVHTVAVADRRVIPLEFYGSRAQGHYRVIPVWERPSEDELLNMLGTSPLPTILLYFGRLTQQRRRDLAARSRQRRKTVIVVDELVVVALTALRGGRLPVMFDFTLPFTTFEPYTVTGSNVAPEMFYGREQEIADIMDPRGASFLYGGRQLGKSALLRHIERMYHRPKGGQIVKWIDLKSREVGHGQPIEYLWIVLLRELQPFDVFSAHYTNPKPEQFQRAVKQWLEQDPSRRIVLLLDEADQFLRQDGERLIDGIPAYTHASHLKNLMESTDRRFKVVFAGTHNVLKAHRFSTSANSPLVHLGHPIEIGPMLGTQERREAYALITEPFALLGYEFEPADLPYRILARTNYYPSLIQIYGYHLLRYLGEKRTSLPFKITSEHVDGVFRDRELSKDIRDRLIWTLRLDVKGRYEAIAYSLALTEAEGKVDSLKGVSVDQLLQLAAANHPDGFRDTDRQEMRSLAEELKGLGILRETESGYYTFRTPNVRLMLGNETEVISALIDVQDRHGRRAELGEVSHRSMLPDQPFLTAPLTSAQLFEVIGNQNGLSIVITPPAMNGRHLKTFLEENASQGSVVPVSPSIDQEGFRRLLEQVNRDVPHTIYLIPCEAAWTKGWLNAASAKLRKLRERSVTRFVFHGDLHHLTECGNYREAVVLATPWNLYEVHTWLEGQNLPANVDVCREIEEVTGNWPDPLQRLFMEARMVGLPRALELLRANLRDPRTRHDLQRQSGMNDRQLLILKLLAEAGEGMVTCAADLLNLAVPEDGLAPDEVEQTLALSESLRYITRTGAHLRLQPFLGTLLA